ncbi:MAG TPA: IS4 family transposase [Ktedonosporobacter sp.]|nr:IS4 family transposase [Ktedonosporobacter sp.]
MNHQDLQEPEVWASKTFGAAELGDQRRTDRLVSMASAIAHAPAASLPKAMRTWGDTLAAYRLLDNEQISHEQIMMPHWIATRQEAAQRPCVLLVADTTEINLSSHKSTKGVGPVGQGLRGRGFYLHTVLALDASNKQILGCAYQEPFVRKPAPKKETRAQRRKRARESQIWEHCAKQIGAAPSGVRWVHVGDRAADIFTFWQTCQQLGCEFVVRVMEDRGVFAQEDEEPAACKLDHLRQLARRLPAQAGRVLHVRAEHDRQARDAWLQMGYQLVRIQPPINGASLQKTEIQAWVIRVWEPSPPEGVEPLEWILVSSVPIESVEQAWERVQWYSWRWLLEDFHHALKTGCQVENRQLRSVAAQWRLLGILTPTALRLLHLRQIAQNAPETPATEVVSAEVVQVVAHLSKRVPEAMSAQLLWRTIARFGGYLNRTCDGPPGWKTLWQGWLYIQTVLEGVHLAGSFAPS